MISASVQKTSVMKIAKQPKVLLTVLALASSLFLDLWDSSLLILSFLAFMAMTWVEKKGKQKMSSGKMSGSAKYCKQEIPNQQFSQGKGEQCVDNAQHKRHEQSSHIAQTSQKQPPRTRLPSEQGAPAWQPSVSPIAPPSFSSSGFENEVHELLHQISPTPESDKVLQLVQNSVERMLAPLIPEAKVEAFAVGNVLTNKSFATAVPELDIVVKADVQILVNRLEQRLERAGLHGIPESQKQLKKSAIRACAQRITTGTGIKFRRSAFQGDEPKVTLSFPEAVGGLQANMPFDLHVNNVSPEHGFAMLAETKELEPRIYQLALLVRRWARDRGISQASKGHLCPYGWSTLSVQFAQMHKAKEAVEDSTASVAELFKHFVRFHMSVFDWSAAIANPYDGTNDLASTLSPWGRSRLGEELRRAHAIVCLCDASLAELLVPWAPVQGSVDGEPTDT